MEQDEETNRLYYATVETAAGSKSQGWHGILYQRSGAPLPVASGEIIETYPTAGRLPFGRFIGVAATSPWHPHGAIPEVLKRGEAVANIVMDGWWHYQIWIWNERSRSARTVGELLVDGKLLLPKTAVIATPMGEFAWHENDDAFGPHGWYPQGWPPDAE